LSFFRSSWSSRVTLASYLLLEIAGALCFAAGLRATVLSLHESIAFYDEGLLLSNSNMLLMGKMPFRDFYTNYPPGIFLVIAGIWKLFGISVHSARWLGIAFHAGIALVCGLLAGKMAGRRFSFLAAGLVALWLSVLSAIPFAWLAGLFVALGATLLLARTFTEDSSRASAPAAGVAVGLVSYFRHDLFMYLAISLCGLLVLRVVTSTDFRLHQKPWSRVSRVALAAAVTVAIFWIPILLVAGAKRVADDLYFDQVHYVMPARTLAFPPLLELRSRYRVVLPAVFVALFEGSVALTFIGPLLAIFVWMVAKPLPARVSAAIVAAVSIAVMPQMLGRTDLYHSVFTLGPGLASATALVLIGARKPLLAPIALLASGLLFLPVRSQWHAGLVASGNSADPPAYPDLRRAADVPDRQARRRREVLALVERETKPAEPIFVGAAQHQLVFVNEMDLYFLADRPGATRYMQFDPNVINREEVQREMIAQLEARRVRLAILSTRGMFSNENNDSRKVGSDLLDRYFESHFHVQMRSGPYLVLFRNSNN
jgi:hypothetical protein